MNKVILSYICILCVSTGLVFAEQGDLDEQSISHLFREYKSVKYADPSVALSFLDSLIKISQQLSNAQLAKVHSEMALQFTYSMNFDSVQHHCSIAMRDTTRDKHSEPGLMAASIMGNLFAERRMADSSYYYHQISVNGAEHNSTDYATYLSNYAISLTRFHAYSEAEDYFKEAYDVAILHKNNQLIVNCISGLVLTSENRIGSHTTQHAEMLKGALKYISEPSEIYLLQQNIAGVMSDLGNLEEAESILVSIKQDYPEFHKHPNPHRDHTLALLEIRKENYGEGIKILTELRANYPNYNRMDEVYLDLSQAYAHLHMPDSSVYYSRLLFDLNDEQKSVANAQALKRSEENMELYGMRLDMLSMQNGQQEKELQVKNLILLMAGLVISFMILGSVFYLANKKRLEEIRVKSSLLSEKNKKLTLIGLEVAQKNQWLNSLKKAVNSVSGDDSDIRRILKTELVRLNKIEKDWANFMGYFEDLYQGFYKKLRNRIPNITTNELRLASLIKLELSNREIADLLHISADSVKSSKYRLKKKLNLTEFEDLAQFISGI